jgi:Tat protein secretion system quality control protein TatD with DNase activity
MPDEYLLGDVHTHLDQYAPDEIPGILERARQAGVGFIICAGTTLDSTRACIQMSQRYDMLLRRGGHSPYGGAPANR